LFLTANRDDREHIDRLAAARLQADIMGTDTLVVSRTDAEAATLLDSNVDERDHPYILGTPNGALPALNDLLTDAIAKGATKEDIQSYVLALVLCRAVRLCVRVRVCGCVCACVCVCVACVCGC
jgi:isocitrate lyase